MSLKALFIDHYDSFSFNVIDLLERVGGISIVHCYFDKIEKNIFEDFDFIVLSPGPKHPKDAIQTIELVRDCIEKKPILGICLGHQILSYLDGQVISRVDNPHHGSTKSINIDPSSALFESISAPLNVATYNSLCVKKSEWKKSEFDVIAWSSCGDVEAIERNIEGKSVSCWYAVSSRVVS